MIRLGITLMKTTNRLFVRDKSKLRIIQIRFQFRVMNFTGINISNKNIMD